MENCSELSEAGAGEERLKWVRRGSRVAAVEAAVDPSCWGSAGRAGGANLGEQWRNATAKRRRRFKRERSSEWLRRRSALDDDTRGRWSNAVSSSRFATAVGINAGRWAMAGRYSSLRYATAGLDCSANEYCRVFPATGGTFGRWR